jgi:hypothetical protein
MTAGVLLFISGLLVHVLGDGHANPSASTVHRPASPPVPPAVPGPARPPLSTTTTSPPPRTPAPQEEPVARERLTRPVTQSKSGLTVTVKSVKQSEHVTRVVLVARNDTGVALRLPLHGGYCLFVGGGKPLQPEPFAGGWQEVVAAGGEPQSGTITFEDQLPDSVGRATLSFTTIFGGGPHSIRVPVMLSSPTAETVR